MYKVNLRNLKSGQFVMFVGESNFEEGIIKAEIYPVTWVGRVEFHIALKNGEISSVYNRDPEQAFSIEFFRVVDPLPECTNDETNLNPNDYRELIEVALDLKAFNLAKDWYGAAYSCDV